MSLVEHLVAKWLDAKRLKVRPQRCVRERNRFSTCSKCADACPASAISLDGGLSIQEEDCTECMKCTVVCPTEAFYDEKYVQYFREMPNREILAFSCEEDKSDQAYIRLGCLTQLDEALLLYALANSEIVTIQFDEEKCSKCSKFDMSLSERLIEIIVEMNSMLIKPAEIYFNNHPSLKMERNYTRRDLFTFFSKKMTRNAVSPFIPDEEEVKNLRTSLKTGLKRIIYFRILEQHQNLFRVNMDTQRLHSLQLELNSHCDGCEVCARVCPTGALRFSEDKDPISAMFNPQQCNGCRSCIDICRKDGLDIVDVSINLQEFLNGDVQALQQKDTQLVKC